MGLNTRRQSFKCASGDSSRTETLDLTGFNIKFTHKPDVKLRDHSDTPLFTSLPTGTALIPPLTDKGVKVDMTSRTSMTINQVLLILAFSRFKCGENGTGAAKAFDTTQLTSIILLGCSHTQQNDETLYLSLYRCIFFNTSNRIKIQSQKRGSKTWNTQPVIFWSNCPSGKLGDLPVVRLVENVLILIILAHVTTCS
ncbi:unnamed protein product [Phytophthora fragariaefolia]|uniref:Unnamed protein product n=1 Tax=Phytophthora fragariaefolia TaxID=1490495 RepID=A0A9W7D3W7_9STRA|nr:unnamed protein product [Phytophthora fragariaefolia]